MQKKTLLSIALLAMTSLHLLAATSNSDITKYYSAASGKSGAALKTALYNIISSGTVARSYDNLWTDFQKTDLRSDGKIWDMYSNTSNFTFRSGQCGTYKVEGDCYNREHSFPKSWFGEATPMYTDLFHLYPTDGYVNNMRSNYAFGNVTTQTKASNNSFSKLGTTSVKLDGASSTTTITVFEPDKDYKGDFARTYFYMITRYEDKLKNWYSSYKSKEGANVTLANNTYPGIQEWQRDLLLEWAKADKVSDKETNRNDAVYGIQKNRNPFIDFCGLEYYIWGAGSGTTVTLDKDTWVCPYESTHNHGGTSATTCAAPAISLSSSSVTVGTSVTVTLSCTTSGATIYYTTDGSTPTTNSTEYTSSFTLTSSTATTKTIRAIAVKSGLTNSSVSSATITWTESSSGGGGTGDNLLWESFSGYDELASDSGTEINSSDSKFDWSNWAWGSFSKVYAGTGGCGKLGSSKATGSMITNSISLTGNATLTFKVKKYSSDSGSLNVTVTGATATGDTSKTPSSSSTWDECTVSITGATGSITIQFATSTKRAYIDDIKLVTSGGSTTTVSAPAFSPEGGTYVGSQAVTITSTTSGATIRYTTNGTAPTATTGTELANGGTVTISNSCTLKAVAVYNGTASDVTSATYTINEITPPTFSPSSGTYTSAQTVTISSETSGATIRYTTDGTAPTATTGTALANGGTVTIGSSCTLQAVAVYNGTASTISSATYTISSTPSSTITIYEKITNTASLTVGEKYLIVYEGGYRIFNGSLTTLDAKNNYTEVTINTGATNYILATDNIDKRSFTITANGDSKYYIKSASGYWIGQTANDNGLQTSTNETGYSTTISFTDGEATIKGSGGAVLRYNSGSTDNRFRYYKSSTYTNQKAICLYKRVTKEVVTSTVSSVNYATLYYGDKNLIVPTGVTAYTYKFDSAGKAVKSKTYAAGSVLPKGEGVVLESTAAATYNFIVSDTSADNDANSNMSGSDEAALTTGGAKYYQLSLAKGDVGTVGWYWGAANGAAFTNGAHKAYLVVPSSLSGVVSASGFAFNDGETTGISSPIDEGARKTDSDDCSIYTLDGRKVNRQSVNGNLPKGIYIMNGKKIIIK